MRFYNTVIAVALFFVLLSTTWWSLHPKAELHEDRLSHVVIPFVPQQEAAVLETLRLWGTFHPCSGWSSRPIAVLPKPRLVFFVAVLSGGSAAKIRDAVSAALPESAADCFETVEWIKMDMEEKEFSYPKGPRLMFELLLSRAQQDAVHYAMLMEPDVRPIRQGWLTKLVALCGWPQSRFWIKGSIFRGNPEVMTMPEYIPSLVHINGNALYNLGDPEFRSFYFKILRAYILRHGDSKVAYDTDFFEFLLDRENYHISRNIAHLFQFSSFIQNMWHSKYNSHEIADGETVLVHGGSDMFRISSLTPRV